MKTFVLSVEGITIEVLQKKIKHINFTIYPPEGAIKVSAPMFVSKAQLRETISNRICWIKKQQDKIKERYYSLKREIKTGELHYFLGKPVLLKVVEEKEATPNVILNVESHVTIMTLTTGPKSFLKKRQCVLNDWYRKQLELELSPFLEKWQKILGVVVVEWKIRKMRSRWGTCYPSEKKVLFNLELIKTAKENIEYVVLHELIHFFERKHNKRFYDYLNRFMPNWRQHKANLDNAPITITY